MNKQEKRILGAAVAAGSTILETFRSVSERLSRFDTPITLPGIHQLYINVGARGVEAVALGLSRKIRTTREDAIKVISEWERREQSCCFSGSVEDILELTETYVFAVSYRHEEMSKWSRKGERLIAKMSDRDQEALVNVIVGHSNRVKYVILWCDQVISTRLKDQKRENSLGWYNDGLLPYACFPVLKLSAHIGDEVLESRVWLKAERSLGRLGGGTVEVNDAIYGLLGDLGANVTIDEVISSIAGMILSGFWPEDLGYWRNDYLQMKKWAVSVLSKMKITGKPHVSAEVEEVDNLEIISIMDSFVHVPVGLDYAEKPGRTDDRLFFLRVTAWNIYIEDIWNTQRKTVSHYMGDIGSFYRFSWWANEFMTVIFGFLRGMDRATAVIAVEDGTGYLLHRMDVNPSLYSHGDHPTEKTLLVLEEVAGRWGIEVNLSQKWSLLYSSSEDLYICLTDPVLRQGLELWPKLLDCQVPGVFHGLTTKLYRCAVEKAGANKPVAERFVHILNSWNRHIKEEYKDHISVRDTLAGATWLEGFSQDKVSFGFYDYLTRSLILGSNELSSFAVSLPSKWEFIQEIRRIAGSSTEDVKILVDEVFGCATELNCSDLVMLKDVASFMVQGGFTTSMNGARLGFLLRRVAVRRGYWSTRVSARDGKIQIMFINQDGEVRVSQRRTNLSEVHAFGLVRPQDTKAVLNVSLLVEDDAEEYGRYDYWKLMEPNTSRDKLQKAFINSVYEGDRRIGVLLVDMSLIEYVQGEELMVVDNKEISFSVDEAAGQLLEELGRRDPAKNDNIPRTGRGILKSEDKCSLPEELHSWEAEMIGVRKRMTEINDRFHKLYSENLKIQRDWVSQKGSRSQGTPGKGN